MGQDSKLNQRTQMKTKLQWTATDLRNATYIGLIEFQDNNKGEWHTFQVLSACAPSDRICFGGACNTGFLESGYIRREEYESTEETLQEMLADLHTYYNDGPQYVSRIVCNERM